MHPQLFGVDFRVSKQTIWTFCDHLNYCVPLFKISSLWFRFLEFHISVHPGCAVYHRLHLHRLHLLRPFQVPQSTQLWGKHCLLVCECAVATLFPSSRHIVYVLLQAKEEDKDATEGVEGNTSVLYFLKFHSRNKDQMYLGEAGFYVHLPELLLSFYHFIFYPPGYLCVREN